VWQYEMGSSGCLGITDANAIACCRDAIIQQTKNDADDGDGELQKLIGGKWVDLEIPLSTLAPSGDITRKRFQQLVIGLCLEQDCRPEAFVPVSLCFEKLYFTAVSSKQQ